MRLLLAERLWPPHLFQPFVPEFSPSRSTVYKLRFANVLGRIDGDLKKVIRDCSLQSDSEIPHFQPFVGEFSEHGLQIAVCESPEGVIRIATQPSNASSMRTGFFCVLGGRLWGNEVVRKWGRTDLTGFCPDCPVRLRLVPSMVSRDFDQILTGP